MKRWGLWCISLLLAMSCDCGSQPTQEQAPAEALADLGKQEPVSQERPGEPTADRPSSERTPTDSASEPPPEQHDAAPDNTTEMATPDPRVTPELSPEPIAERSPAREARSCDTPNPQGCSNANCPAGLICWRGYDTTKECYPLSCSCNKDTNIWRCDENCDGGKCVSPCVANPPDMTCCQNGKPVTPQCNAGVFSCPTGAVQKQLPGCGAYTGTPETGVRCEGKICPSNERCCYSGAVLCSASTTSCFSTNACDGPEDCGGGGGNLCCARPAANDQLESWCTDQQDCLSQPKRWVVCNQTSDCPSGYNCCQTTLNASSDFGVCLNQPC